LQSSNDSSDFTKSPTSGRAIVGEPGSFQKWGECAASCARRSVCFCKRAIELPVCLRAISCSSDTLIARIRERYRPLTLEFTRNPWQGVSGEKAIDTSQNRLWRSRYSNHETPRYKSRMSL